MPKITLSVPGFYLLMEYSSIFLSTSNSVYCFHYILGEPKELLNYK